MSKSLFLPACILTSAMLVLGGCGNGNGNGANKSSADAPKNPSAISGLVAAASSVGKKAPNLSDGVDVCFAAIAKDLGADAKVSDITSFFSAGSAIDSSASQPIGDMTMCSVDYQDPADPKKLVSKNLDVKSGIFSQPRPVEISVSGGDAATFKLDDYLVPLSTANAAELKTLMETQKARLEGVYGSYAWTSVRLSPPGAFSDVHTLRLDVTGRLAKNDIKQTGYASISLDGKKITMDHLQP